MKTLEYCNTLENELSAWRQKIAHVTEKIDGMPSIDKFKLTEHIEGLHIVLTELEDRISELKTDCLTSWNPEEDDFRVKFDELGMKLKEAEGVYHDYDFGG